MKKLIFALLLSFFLVFIVKAETTIDDLVYQTNSTIITDIYNNLLTEYSSINYPYYNISFDYGELTQDYEVYDSSQSYITGYLYYFTSNSDYSTEMGRIYISYTCPSGSCLYTTYRETIDNPNYGSFNSSVLELTNTFKNYSGNLLLEGSRPSYYIDTLENQYTSVNLDNYEYVILSLKDYSTTTAFQTNLEVKGQIGITPVYNFGQTSKDSITGVQVQDRCNVSYDNYTTYPFYIIQSDIQNNAIYYVKSCLSNSSFKFSNSIFNIEYITQANIDSPTITINGKTYNTIPYDDLPSTATKNEEDNYIPGESGSATDTGGIDSAIKNVQQSLSSIWNTITYFTSLVGLLFSSLPNELRVVLYSSFVITITIGIIKFFIK